MVLALLGVIAALAAPTAALLDRRRSANDVTRTAASVADLLGEARMTALARNTTVEVLIEPGSARAWVLIGTGRERRLGATITFARAPGVDLLGRARVRFAFDASGTAAADTLFVRGAEVTQRVTVDPWSGAADVSGR